MTFPQGGKDYLIGRNNANDVDLNRLEREYLSTTSQLFLSFTFSRDFPDLNQVVYEGAEENNHLLRVCVILLQPTFPETETNLLQEANFDHRIQPETESVIKMIMDTPFVVRIIIIGSCFSTILNLLILGVSQHARR